MSKKGFAFLELGCAALLIFTAFVAEGNFLIITCAIVLILDCLIRYFKSSED